MREAKPAWNAGEAGEQRRRAEQPPPPFLIKVIQKFYHPSVEQNPAYPFQNLFQAGEVPEVYILVYEGFLTLLEGLAEDEREASLPRPPPAGEEAPPSTPPAQPPSTPQSPRSHPPPQTTQNTPTSTLYSHLPFLTLSPERIDETVAGG